MFFNSNVLGLTAKGYCLLTSRTTVGSDNFHFMAPFLAMTELKRALFCSFGLTKTFFNFNQFHQLRNLNLFSSFSIAKVRLSEQNTKRKLCFLSVFLILHSYVVHPKGVAHRTDIGTTVAGVKLQNHVGRCFVGSSPSYFLHRHHLAFRVFCPFCVISCQ